MRETDLESTTDCRKVFAVPISPPLTQFAIGKSVMFPLISDPCGPKTELLHIFFP